MRQLIISFLFSVFFVTYSKAQVEPPVRIPGQVISEYGGTFAVQNMDFPADPERNYWVVFEVAESPEDKARLNARIVTLARFLNMHVAAGVPRSNLKVAAVLHAGAAKDVLKNAAYHQRYGVDNPNDGLLNALEEAGADVYICGQSIAARGFGWDDIHPGVKIALSAMTVLIELQDEGYRMIKF